MCDHDQRVAAAHALRRMNQDGFEFQAVASLVGNRFLLRQFPLAKERV